MLFFRLILLVCFAGLSQAAAAQSISSSEGRIRVEAVVENLREPWGFAHLPGSALLITERGGRLLFIAANGSKQTVSGVPKVFAQGQGGLLDVIAARDFATSRLIFLSMAVPQSGGAGTAVYRAELSKSGTELRNVRKIFEMAQGSSGGRHFGSRIVEALDGTLYITTGDRGNRPSAQDLGRHEGSVVRITKSGKVPADNPFVGANAAQPEIWSYGHRNPQGAAMDAQGRIWVVEHGAKGGDEINLVKKGGNFGWPVISYGTHYSGGKIGEGAVKEGMEQPDFYWDPSIAPSGMMIYSGKLWPAWKGNIFVGSLKFDYISRLSGSPLTEQEKIRGSRTARVRDVREGPEGRIWFLSVDDGALYRMSPVEQ